MREDSDGVSTIRICCATRACIRTKPYQRRSVSSLPEARRRGQVDPAVDADRVVDGYDERETGRLLDVEQGRAERLVVVDDVEVARPFTQEAQRRGG